MWQKYLFVILAGLIGAANAFWWPKTTTESPNAQMLQQIPLTYFRTYTYQPLAGGPFSVPFFGFGAAQTPLLSPSSHYDPYAVTSYAAARRHDVAAKTGVTPPASSSTSTTSSTTSTTTPAPTTTTTTTTTTPAPTTTTSSTTTPAPPQAPEGASYSAGAGSGSSLLRYGEYPTYTRRVSNLYNARPQYPYPDYFNYQPQGGLAEPGVGVGVGGTRIQFVPCMCPVSVPSLSSSAAPAAVGSASTSNPAARHIDSHEMQADGEMDADAEMEADPEAGDDEEDMEDDEGVTKAQPDPQETTSNSPV
ncbi:endochitinase A [Drosophila subobscura]|uniref:endochitinase A n=1 Tax=Drosophila subobscura TaxID=7241 RepID=UPI00155AA350|nr:endochitinase A [Drosophila subobscura]